MIGGVRLATYHIYVGDGQCARIIGAGVVCFSCVCGHHTFINNPMRHHTTPTWARGPRHQQMGATMATKQTNTTGRRRNQKAIDALNAAAIAAGAVVDASPNETPTAETSVAVATLDRMPLKTAMVRLGFAHIDGKQIRRVLRKYYATERGRVRPHGNGEYRDNWMFGNDELPDISALILKHVRGAKSIMPTDETDDTTDTE